MMEFTLSNPVVAGEADGNAFVIRSVVDPGARTCDTRIELTRARDGDAVQRAAPPVLPRGGRGRRRPARGGLRPDRDQRGIHAPARRGVVDAPCDVDCTASTVVVTQRAVAPGRACERRTGFTQVSNAALVAAVQPFCKRRRRDRSVPCFAGCICRRRAPGLAVSWRCCSSALLSGALAGCGGSDNAGGGSVLSSLAGTRTDRVTTGETSSVPTTSAPATTSPTTPAETAASPEPPPAAATETTAVSEPPATTAAAPAATVTVTTPSKPPSTRPAATTPAKPASTSAEPEPAPATETEAVAATTSETARGDHERDDRHRSLSAPRRTRPPSQWRRRNPRVTRATARPGAGSSQPSWPSRRSPVEPCGGGSDAMRTTAPRLPPAAIRLPPSATRPAPTAGGCRNCLSLGALLRRRRCACSDP